MRKLFALAAALVISAPAFAAEKDIVDTAAEAGKFKTLLAAAEAAGLVETLKGDGPYTVFAPTDEAFAKLGDDTIASLLKPENKEKLAGILLYHVVPGEVKAADAAKLDGKEVGTANKAAKLKVTVKGAEVYVDKAKVVKPDIEASNGVIHVIDAVILPSK